MIAIRHHVANGQESSRLMLRLHGMLGHRCVTSVATRLRTKSEQLRRRSLACYFRPIGPGKLVRMIEKYGSNP
jgi:hypothetical protein